MAVSSDSSLVKRDTFIHTDFLPVSSSSSICVRRCSWHRHSFTERIESL